MLHASTDFQSLTGINLIPRLLLHGEEPGYETTQQKEKNLPCNQAGAKVDG